MPDDRRRVLVIFGTRPEAIKMCPLVRALSLKPELDVRVCVTAQHRELLDGVLEVFHVKPDYDLDVMTPNQTQPELLDRIQRRLQRVLQSFRPDLALVHGDTTTAFAAALCCFYGAVPVGHVEAGLRTYDNRSPYPEEFNRQAIGAIARHHFAPTRAAVENLLREGKRPDRVHLTGNTGIDALGFTVRAEYQSLWRSWAGDARLLLLTAHRRENHGAALAAAFRGIRRAVDAYPDVRLLYPVHPSPVMRTIAESCLSGHPRIRLTGPMDVIDFHNLLARSYLVLTDSGGIQEEATALGKPVLVLREATERPEGVAAGVLRLVGTREGDVFGALSELLGDDRIHANMSHAAQAYGDGHAARRIADIVAGAGAWGRAGTGNGEATITRKWSVVGAEDGNMRDTGGSLGVAPSVFDNGERHV